jgi:hypothetical protein
LPCVLCALLSVFPDCSFLIAPSVFSNIYLSCVLCALLSQTCLPQLTLKSSTGQINVRENWRGNQEWTIRKHRQQGTQDTGRRQTKQNTYQVSTLTYFSTCPFGQLTKKKVLVRLNLLVVQIN